MDSVETKGEEEKEEEEEKERIKKGLFYILFRCCFGIFFSLLTTFSLTFLLLILAVFLGNLSIWNPISVPSQCKIVSSSVDLRSSKVCELGFLNYKAKHVFYPFDRKKFRCHYDYYWASVFKPEIPLRNLNKCLHGNEDFVEVMEKQLLAVKKKYVLVTRWKLKNEEDIAYVDRSYKFMRLCPRVEYMDHSGQQRLAQAEAPSEALPSNCRPNFGAAWLTKDKFKVNETYACWYTMGISTVNMYQDGLFNCQAKDPSNVEMLRRYFILSMRMLKSFFSNGTSSLVHWRWDAVVGLITGFSTSLLSFGLVAVLHQMKSSIRQLFSGRVHSAVHFKRICLFIAYFSFMGWLGIQYVKRLGLIKIFSLSYGW